MPFLNYPPGLVYLAQIVPNLLFAPFFISIAHQYASENCANKLPIYVWIIAYILATPTLFIVKDVINHLREEREIKQFGARRVPRVPTYLPAGIDGLVTVLKGFTHGYVGDGWGDWAESLGPIYNLRVFKQDMIFTTEPAHIEAMLSTEFNNFEKGEPFRWYVQSVLGTGVFNSDSEMWKFHRAMTRPFFMCSRVMDFHRFDKFADLAILRMRERFAQGESIDFQDIISRYIVVHTKRLLTYIISVRFTMDTATELLFGSCVNSLTAPLAYAHNSSRQNAATRPHPSDKFGSAFDQALDQIALRIRRANSWPFFEFWKDKTIEPMEAIYDYIDPIIEHALDKRKAEDKNRHSRVSHDDIETLLDHLVEQTTDSDFLRDETLNILMAGRDPTKSTITFAIYNLSRHPNLLATLREEILAKIGPTRRLAFNDMKECPLLRAVINETLRLFPAIPFNTRHSKFSTVWPANDSEKPFYIPAGVNVTYSVWLMQRRTDLWGPDAAEFDPYRWLDDRRQKYSTSNSFIYLPFNAGPRTCLGQQFAYNEASFMLVRLLQTFDSIVLDPEAQPPAARPPLCWKSTSSAQPSDLIWPKSHLTLYAYGGIWLKMEEAQNIKPI
ncbi:cytochrome P450 [Ramaria rubella]|nr:cytochrome P450 [Ramaria rubella]